MRKKLSKVTVALSFLGVIALQSADNMELVQVKSPSADSTKLVQIKPQPRTAMSVAQHVGATKTILESLYTFVSKNELFNYIGNTFDPLNAETKKLEELRKGLKPDPNQTNSGPSPKSLYEPGPLVYPNRYIPMFSNIFESLNLIVAHCLLDEFHVTAAHSVLSRLDNVIVDTLRRFETKRDEIERSKAALAKTPKEFWIENGFLGMKRDLILRLCGLLGSDTIKMKMMIGMTHRQYQWTKLRSFALERYALRGRVFKRYLTARFIHDPVFPSIASRARAMVQGPFRQSLVDAIRELMGVNQYFCSFFDQTVVDNLHFRGSSYNLAILKNDLLFLLRAVVFDMSDDEITGMMITFSRRLQPEWPYLSFLSIINRTRNVSWHDILKDKVLYVMSDTADKPCSSRVLFEMIRNDTSVIGKNNSQTLVDDTNAALRAASKMSAELKEQLESADEDDIEAINGYIEENEDEISKNNGLIKYFTE